MLKVLTPTKRVGSSVEGSLQGGKKKKDFRLFPTREGRRLARKHGRGNPPGGVGGGAQSCGLHCSKVSSVESQTRSGEG